MKLIVDGVSVNPLPIHKNKIAEVFFASMQDDPMYCYMFHEISNHDKYLVAFWKALVHYSIVNGEVYSTKDLNAGACWLLPSKCKFTLSRLALSKFQLPLAVFSFPSLARNRAMGIFDYLDKVQRNCIAEPHYYLMALGVSPHMQGKGIGSKLIEPVLQQADAMGYKCYLETETEINVKFYEKNGFHVEQEFIVPKHGLKYWAMVRNPKNSFQ
jgi:GNAT superfamily N-acetyltransferase